MAGLKILAAAWFAVAVVLMAGSTGYAAPPDQDLSPAQFTTAWGSILTKDVNPPDERVMVRIAIASLLKNNARPDFQLDDAAPPTASLVLSTADNLRKQNGDLAKQPLLRSTLTDVLKAVDPAGGLGTMSSYRPTLHGGAGSVGMTLTVVDGAITVLGPQTDSPARRAGVLPGDRMLAIDGEPADPADLAGFVGRLRGEPGSLVALTVARTGLAEPLAITMRREVIRAVSLETSRTAGVTRFRVSALAENVTRTLGEAMAMDKAKAETPTGYILDLRGNTGGLLYEAVALSDLFVDGGEIVSIHGPGKAIASYNARPGDRLDGRPLIVLVDQRTSSGGEVIAAALKDHRRAVLVGARTFGAGSIRTVIPLGGDDLLTLTTGRIVSPAGEPLEGTGVTPHVIVTSGAAGAEVARGAPALAWFDEDRLLAAAADKSDVSSDLATLHSTPDDAAMAYAVRLLHLTSAAESKGLKRP